MSPELKSYALGVLFLLLRLIGKTFHFCVFSYSHGYVDSCPGVSSVREMSKDFLTLVKMNIITLSGLKLRELELKFTQFWPFDLMCVPGALGFIPPPLIFGMGIDSTCLFWSSVCGEKGACLLYDNVAYRHLYVSIAIALKSSAFVLYATTWQCLRKNYRKYIKNSEGYLTPTELFASNVTLDNLGKEITKNPVNRTKFIYNLEDHETCDNVESVL